MSLHAYQRTQRSVESPRETEYRIFGCITRDLMSVSALPRTDGRVIEALDRNRRLWSTLATDCALSENGLPQPLKAQIISLSRWVSRYASQVMRDNARIEPLIEINRAIMQGLEPRRRG